MSQVPRAPARPPLALRPHPALVLLHLAAAGSLLGVPAGLTATAFAAAAAWLAATARGREWVLWGMCAAGLGAVAAFGTGTQATVTAAAVQAARYAALMIAITFVQIAIRRSTVPALLRAALDRLPDAARRPALYGLSHFGGAARNLSSLAVLAASVGGAAWRPAARLADGMVLLRGFATAPAWSPYSYFMPLLLGVFPGWSWPQVALVGAGVALAFALVGLCCPPFAGRTREHAGPAAAPDAGGRMPAGGGRSLLGLAVYAGGVLAATQALELSFLATMVCVAPLLALAWAALEAGRDPSRPVSAAIAADTAAHCRDRLPAIRYEVVALATAGFLSGLAPALPASWLAGLAGHLGGEALPIGVVALLFLGMAAVMAAGINPVVFVALTGQLASGAATSTAVQAQLLTTMLCLWVCFAPMSPFAAANLVVARELGTDVAAQTFGHNRAYNAASVVLSILLGWAAGFAAA